MKEYDLLLEEYISEYYLLFLRHIPEDEWGNKEIASEYLEKFFLPKEEYLKFWKPIQDSIFKNQNSGLPKKVFRRSFFMLAIRGGVLFEKEDFEKLKCCMQSVGDKNMVLIQNSFGREDIPVFRMKYPTSITWEELMSGNYISTGIFEVAFDEYFVFGESGVWGKYSANDYINPLGIIGFKPGYASLFYKNFATSREEHDEIHEWLPRAYKKLIK